MLSLCVLRPLLHPGPVFRPCNFAPASLSFSVPSLPFCISTRISPPLVPLIPVIFVPQLSGATTDLIFRRTSAYEASPFIFTAMACRRLPRLHFVVFLRKTVSQSDPPTMGSCGSSRLGRAFLFFSVSLPSFSSLCFFPGVAVWGGEEAALFFSISIFLNATLGPSPGCCLSGVT